MVFNLVLTEIIWTTDLVWSIFEYSLNITGAQATIPAITDNPKVKQHVYCVCDISYCAVCFLKETLHVAYFRAT